MFRESGDQQPSPPPAFTLTGKVHYFPIHSYGTTAKLQCFSLCFPNTCSLTRQTGSNLLYHKNINSKKRKKNGTVWIQPNTPSFISKGLR